MSTENLVYRLERLIETSDEDAEYFALLNQHLPEQVLKLMFEAHKAALNQALLIVHEELL